MVIDFAASTFMTFAKEHLKFLLLLLVIYVRLFALLLPNKVYASVIGPITNNIG